jgi:hypothetical protein
MNALDNQSPPASPYSRISGKTQHLKEQEKVLQPSTGSERTGSKTSKQQQDLKEPGERLATSNRI